jgi:hypothetical protein
VEEEFSQVVHGKKRTVFKEKLFDRRVEAHLIALRCSAPPYGHSAWTLQLLTLPSQGRSQPKLRLQAQVSQILCSVRGAVSRSTVFCGGSIHMIPAEFGCSLARFVYMSSHPGECR